LAERSVRDQGCVRKAVQVCLLKINQCGSQLPKDDSRDGEKGAKGVVSLYPPLRGRVSLQLLSLYSFSE
jgi:hypothetical protein